MKIDVEDAALRGDVDLAFAKLDDLDGSAGHSLWSISTRIGLLQTFRGLEAQKEWSSRLRERGASHEVGFFAFWWSVRAEDDTSPERFLAETSKRIRRWDLDAISLAHIDFQLCHKLPSPGEEANLLVQASGVSLIDLYDAFVEVAGNALVEGRPSASAFGQVAARFSDTIPDPRLPKLAFLAGDRNGLERIPAGAVAVRDSSHEAAARSARSSGVPEDLEEARAALFAGTASPSPYGGPVWERASHALRDVDVPGLAGIRARSELRKLGLVLDRTAFGQWCRALASQADAPAVHPNPYDDRRRFLGTRYVEPEVLRALPTELQETYAERLSCLYGSTSSSCLMADLFAGRRQPDDSAVRRSLAPTAVRSAAILAAHQAGEYERSLALAEEAQRAGPVVTRLSLQAEILALLALGRLRDAVVSCVAHYMANPELMAWLPLEQVAAAVDSEVGASAHLSSLAELPILFDLLARLHGLAAYDSRRAYACEDFLLTLGVEKPSEIQLEDFPGTSATLIYFLRHICVPAVLKLSTAYGSERELEDERIRVCRALVDIDDEHAEEYLDEARDLVRGRTVKVALRELQGSKVSIDESEIHLWALRQLGEDYERYKTLLAAGVIAVDEDYRSALLKAAETGQYPKSLFDVPENEASALFGRMASRLFHELAFNPEHGFDCYLSLRVRHGTLSGLLRGPVDHERLVTRKDGATGEYKPNEHWPMSLSEELDDFGLAAIDHRLRTFSRSYDDLIARVTNEVIQVRREEKPEGLFQLGVPTLSVYGLATEIKGDTSFADFIDKCIAVFWSLADKSLERVREYVDEDLRSEIHRCFDELESDISGTIHVSLLGARSSTGALVDAITRARTGVNSALDRMQDWFVPPTSTSSLPFTITELVDVGLATIKSFYREFEPQLTVSAADVPSLTNSLRLFSDIFFFLFENIYEHSDLARPRVDVMVRVDGNLLKVRVENEVGDPERHRSRIETAQERIEGGTYASSVRREGGTGLPKLAKLIKEDGRPSQIGFGLTADAQRFAVDFSLPLTLIASPADDRDR